MKNLITSEKTTVYGNLTTTVCSSIDHGVLLRKKAKSLSLKRLLFIGLLCLLSLAGLQTVSAIDKTSYISEKNGNGYFVLAKSGNPAPLFISNDDYPGVIRALKDLQADINRVTGNEPGLSTDKLPNSKNIVIVGTLGKSPVIDKLVKQKKLDVSDISGKWETFLLQGVEKPLP